MKKPPAQYFRAGAGAVIINGQGMVLALERADHAGSWQLPQGGLKEGEEPRAAAVREAGEETGIPSGSLQHLADCPDLLAYELPPDARRGKLGRGQVHYWYLFRFTGQDTEIRPDAGEEFRGWKWCPMDELIAQVTPFRRPVYEKLRRAFSEHLA